MYALPPDCLGSMRRILPSGELSDCALPRGAVLVVAAPAVAGADVHQLVGAEDHQAAVVVGLGVVHAQHEPGAVGVGAIVAGAVVLPDRLRAALLGVVDVEQPRLRVVGREGHREQALLAAGRDLRADVEERLGQRLAAADDDDLPRLLDDEEPPLVAGRRGEVERRLEVADLDQAHAAAGRRAALGRGGAARVVVRARRRVGRRVGLAGVRVRSAGREQRGGDEGEREGRAEHPRRMPWPCNAGRTGIDCSP